MAANVPPPVYGVPPQAGYATVDPIYGVLGLAQNDPRRRRRVGGLLLLCCACLGLLAAVIVPVTIWATTRLPADAVGAGPPPIPTTSGGGPTTTTSGGGPTTTTSGGGSTTTQAPAPTQTAPPGSCCCVGCANDVCVEDVATYQECIEVCTPPQTAHQQSCAATWSPGQSCAECDCESPVDCCPEDPFVFEGSPYASAEMTLCGGRDYNCDGNDDQLPCCTDDAPIDNQEDERTIYLASSCNASLQVPLSTATNEVCGACTGTDVVAGWACVEGVARRKRFVPPCPAACNGHLEMVTPATPPDVGQCALFVTGCIEPNGGDLESCCQVVTL